MQWQKLEITENVLQRCRRQLDEQSDIFSFSDEPLLAPLLACLGIQYELGKPDMDRLTPILGLEKNSWHGWQSEIIKIADQVAIRIFNDSLAELNVPSSFTELIHPMSFDENGRVRQLVIVPGHVAAGMSLKNIELVIVKAWINSTFLSETEPVNYVTANVWEINNNSTQWQVEFLNKGQLPFSGIHDLVDHIVNSSFSGLTSCEYLSELQEIFKERQKEGWNRYELIHSYLIGALLDDLAQPPLYGSEKHRYLIEKSIQCLRKKLVRNYKTTSLKVFPQTLNELMHSLRNDQKVFFNRVDKLFRSFDEEARALAS